MKKSSVFITRKGIIYTIGDYCAKFIKTPPPDFNKISYSASWVYTIKYYSCLEFFKIMHLYNRFISWLTRFYPFSLLYTDRLFHHRNVPIREFMIKMEDVAKKSDVKVFIPTGDCGDLLTSFYGHLRCRIKNREEVIKRMEKGLQDEFGTIYVRDKKDHIQISIPTETLKNITHYQ